MKKFAFCLLISFAYMQSSHALESLEIIENHTLRQQVGATSAFTESALEMEAILNAIANGSFPAVKPSEFAVSLFRETQKVDTKGKVNYILETCVIGKKNKCKALNKYRATIRVQPNGIGPNEITVLKIEPIGRSENLFGGTVDNLENEGDIFH